MRYFNAGLLCMAVLTRLIARRVLPFFAKRAVAGLDIPAHTRSGHWQLGLGVVAIACLTADAPRLAALALAATGLIALAQWVSWKPWAVRRVLARVGLYRLVWHPALFDLALFVVLLYETPQCPSPCCYRQVRGDGRRRRRRRLRRLAALGAL
ncbi:hypothetical protein G6F65_020531 [Rhizopus arrhizus]|nr:hypothetical protein G6F65_020531 [Rhizopus arrhizus]